MRVKLFPVDTEVFVDCIDMIVHLGGQLMDLENKSLGSSFVLILSLPELCQYICWGLLLFGVKLERDIVSGIYLLNPLSYLFNLLVQFILEYFACCHTIRQSDIDLLKNVHPLAFFKNNLLKALDPFIFFFDYVENLFDTVAVSNQLIE